MTQTMALQIQQPFSDQLKKGYPLISKDAVDARHLPAEQGTLLKLLDHHNRFIGTGYYGIQNKGIGWVLTTDANETIDQTFLRRNSKRPSTIVPHSSAMKTQQPFVCLTVREMASAVSQLTF